MKHIKKIWAKGNNIYFTIIITSVFYLKWLGAHKIITYICEL